MRFLLCTFIHVITTGLIFSGMWWLNALGDLPTLWAIVCFTALEVCFLYANGLAAQKYLTPNRGG